MFAARSTLAAGFFERLRTAGDRRVWGEVPGGFVIVRGVRTRLFVRRDRADAIDGSLCRRAKPVNDSNAFKGRRPLAAARLSTGETVLIRAYHHGGVLRVLTRGVFFTWPPRPVRELVITTELRRRGVPTVEPYAACVERIGGPFYRGWFVTRQLKDAQDLWAACRSGLIASIGPDRALEAVARSIRRMHANGVYHADLNLKNILVREEPTGPGAYLIDFDRATLMAGCVPDRLAKRNLMRLRRSARKLDPESRYFSAADWQRFAAFYHKST